MRERRNGLEREERARASEPPDKQPQSSHSRLLSPPFVTVKKRILRERQREGKAAWKNTEGSWEDGELLEGERRKGREDGEEFLHGKRGRGREAATFS